jgi:hypothetical protein
MTWKWRRELARLGLPALTVAVAAGTVGGFIAVDRAFRLDRRSVVPRPSQAGPSSATPSFSPSPSELIGAQDCLSADVSGDFDGDGRLDEALVYPKMAIEAPTCEHEARPSWTQVVAVSLATGTQIHFEFECTAVLCRFQGWDHPGGLFAAPDFDGDGRAELAVSVSQGATFSLFTVYRVTPQGLQELQLAPPGDAKAQLNHELDPGPVRFLGLSDLYGRAWVSCDLTRDGTRVVIQERARRIGDSPTWRYHKTVLAFDGDTFTVISSRDATIPEESRLFDDPGLSSCA